MGKRLDHPRSNEAFGITTERPLSKKELRSRRNREKDIRQGVQSLREESGPPPRIDFRTESQIEGSYPDVGAAWTEYLDLIP